VTEWVEGQICAMESVPNTEGSNWPFIKISNKWELQDHHNDTKVTFTIFYELAEGLSNEGKIDLEVEGITISMTAGLKQYVESGRPLTEDDKFVITQEVDVIVDN